MALSFTSCLVFADSAILVLGLETALGVRITGEGTGLMCVDIDECVVIIGDTVCGNIFDTVILDGIDGMV